MLTKLKNLFFENPISKNARIIHLIIIFTLPVIIYLNIFQNTFIMDDRTIFFQWPEVKNLDIPGLLKGTYPKKFETQPVYRPIKGVIHAIGYNISGNNSYYYHLQSILVNAIIALLIYSIVTLISKKSSLAFLTALIFAIHPIHTEAVTFITASFDTIGIMFFFISLYLYIKFKVSEFKSTFYYIASVIFALLAFLTYEITLILPLILILYDYIFGTLNKKNWKQSIQYLPYFLLTALYILLRSLLHPITSGLEYAAGSIYLTILTTLKAFLVYIYSLIIPINLSVIRTLPGDIISVYDQNPMENIQKIKDQTILDFPIILAMLIIIALVFTFFYFLKKRPLISFCIGWFFIALLPIANIFPLRQIMAERYIYLASFGAIFLFSYLILFIYKLGKSKLYIKNLLLVFILIIILIFSYLTIQRNTDYKTEIDMFKSLSKQENGGYYPKYFLGKYYFTVKEYKNSVYYLNLLTNSRYDYVYEDAYYYLAMSYLRLGQASEANKAYEKMVTLSPNYDKERLKILKNLTASSNTPKESIDKVTGNKIYNTGVFTLTYPKDWDITHSTDLTTITNPNNGLNIFVSYNVLGLGETKEGYIKDVKINKYGTLIQEGTAKIPSAQYAYVRIWNQNNIKTAHFILFNNNEIVEIFAKPFDQGYLKDINLILNSVRFNSVQ